MLNSNLDYKILNPNSFKLNQNTMKNNDKPKFISTSKMDFNKKTLEHLNIVTEEQKNNLRKHNFDFKYENNDMVTTNNIYYNKKDYHPNIGLNNNKKNNLNLIQNGQYPKYSSYNYNYLKIQKEDNLNELNKIKENIENIRRSNIILGGDHNNYNTSVMKNDYDKYNKNKIDSKIKYNNIIKMEKDHINFKESNTVNDYNTIFLKNYNEKPITVNKEFDNLKNDLRNHHFEFGYENNNYLPESKEIGILNNNEFNFEEDEIMKGDQKLSKKINEIHFEEDDILKGDQRLNKKQNKLPVNNKSNFSLGENNNLVYKTTYYKENFKKNENVEKLNYDKNINQYNNITNNDYKNSYETENNKFYKKYDPSKEILNSYSLKKKDNLVLGNNNDLWKSEMKSHYKKFEKVENNNFLADMKKNMQKSNFQISENSNFNDLTEYQKNYLKLENKVKIISKNYENPLTVKNQNGEYNTIYRDNFYLK